jgi:hypothetical protein
MAAATWTRGARVPFHSSRGVGAHGAELVAVAPLEVAVEAPWRRSSEQVGVAACMRRLRGGGISHGGDKKIWEEEQGREAAGNENRGDGGVAALPEKWGRRWGCGSYTRRRPGEGLEAACTSGMQQSLPVDMTVALRFEWNSNSKLYSN